MFDGVLSPSVLSCYYLHGLEYFLKNEWQSLQTGHDEYKNEKEGNSL